MYWQTPCWLARSFSGPAATSSLTTRGGGRDQDLPPQQCSPASTEEMGLTRHCFSFSPRQLLTSLSPQTGLLMNVSLQESNKSKLNTTSAVTGNHTLRYVSLTLSRGSLWPTSWKPLRTGQKTVLPEQTQCREKPRPWDLISNSNGSSPACTLLATLPRSPADASQSFQHRLPSHAATMSSTSTSSWHGSHLKHHSLQPKPAACKPTARKPNY